MAITFGQNTPDLSSAQVAQQQGWTQQTDPDSGQTYWVMPDGEGGYSRVQGDPDTGQQILPAAQTASQYGLLSAFGGMGQGVSGSQQDPQAISQILTQAAQNAGLSDFDFSSAIQAAQQANPNLYIEQGVNGNTGVAANPFNVASAILQQSGNPQLVSAAQNFTPAQLNAGAQAVSQWNSAKDAAYTASTKSDPMEILGPLSILAGPLLAAYGPELLGSLSGAGTAGAESGLAPVFNAIPGALGQGAQETLVAGLGQALPAVGSEAALAGSGFGTDAFGATVTGGAGGGGSFALDGSTSGTIGNGVAPATTSAGATPSSLAPVYNAAPGVAGAGAVNTLVADAGQALPAVGSPAALAGSSLGGGGLNLPSGLQNILGNVAGSAISALGANSAANTIANAANTAANDQQNIFNQQLALEQPFITAGQNALPALTAGSAPGGQFNKPYTLADFQSGPQSGLYNFANNQAQEALKNSMQAGGQNLSSNSAIGAGTLASNLANQYYNTGFNENQASNTMALNTLQGLAGEGQSSVGAVSSDLNTLGTTQGNAALTAGNANAAATQSTANAIGSLLSNTLKDSSTMSYLSSLFS